MITSEVFRKTEKMLYSYYRDKKRLMRLKNKVEILEITKNRLYEDMKNSNVSLHSDAQAISYDKPMVQSSSDGVGQAERELMRLIERMEEKYIRLYQEILKKKAVILDIEAKNADIEYVISLMSEEAKQFIELKYGEGASIYTIADKLPISKTTATRRREEILEDIANYFNFCGTKTGQSRDFF